MPFMPISTFKRDFHELKKTRRLKKHENWSQFKLDMFKSDFCLLFISGLQSPEEIHSRDILGTSHQFLCAGMNAEAH